MSLGGLLTVSFYNPADGTVVQLNSLLEKEGELIISRPFEDNKNSRGESIWGGSDNMIELMVDGASSLFTQLQTWERSGTRVRAVGAGFNRNLQWYEDTFLQILPKNHLAPGNLNGRIIRLHRPGPNLNIFANRNLLAYLGWQDANANNAADNYTFTGLSPTAFSSLIQTLGSVANYSSMSTGILANAFNAVVFPISGVRIDASVDVTTLHSVLNYHFQTFRARSFANAELNSVVLSSPSTGVKSVQQTTPNSTYYLVYEFAQGNGVATSGNMGVRCPAMTTDRSLTPGTSFMDF